ncbi:MAG: GatB/YqeY domain-containing protein [Gammaproteobacteria bacterium]
MSALKQRLNDDVKTALKSGDKNRVAALRLVLAAVKQREVDERVTLEDADLTALLDKLAKQRRESIDQYRQGGREDLVAREQYELDLIVSYLPAALPQAEIDAAIAAAIGACGATSIKDMGKVMAALKPALQGRADMAAVSALVRARLG